MDNKDLAIARHCWALAQGAAGSKVMEQGQVCIKELEWGQERKLAMTFGDLQLSLLNQVLTDTAKVAGVINGELSVDWPQGQKPKGTMDLYLDPAAIHLLSLQEHNIEKSIELEALRISSVLSGDDMQINLAFAPTQDDSQVKLGGLRQSELQGSIHLVGWEGTRLSLLLKQELVIKFNLANQDVSIAEHCWALLQETKASKIMEQGQVCINKLEWGKMRKLAMTVRDLQLSLLNDILADIGTATGVINGELSLDWPQGQKPKGNMDLYLSPAAIHLLSLQEHNIEESIKLESLRISSLLSGEDLQFKLALDSSTLGNSQVNLLVQPFQKDRPISGNLHLESLSLGHFMPFIPALEQLKGELRADVVVSGHLYSPLFSGKVGLNGLSASGAALPLGIQQLDAVLDLMGQSAQLEAQAMTIANSTTNDKLGELKLSGAFNWANKPLSVELDLIGKNVVIGTNILNLELEPQFHFSLQEHAMLLTGKLNIPSGRIKLRELPKDAVLESSDVILVTKAKPQSAVALPLILDVHIQLNDDVKIDAFGLKSKLTGVLALQQNVNKPLTANGEISLIDGTYIAWGQHLVIKQGQLIFSGVLAKPFLHIDAIREPRLTENGVIAGVRIEGAAENPEVKIYSEPAMSQQEAMSYLLRGRGLSSGSDSGNDFAIASMLLGFGLGQSEGIVSSVGNNFGIRDLSLETKEAAGETLVEVKGQILPGVEVGYGVSLTTHLPQITLRYEIFPKFYVEGVSGVVSALDLLYELEL